MILIVLLAFIKVGCVLPEHISEPNDSRTKRLANTKQVPDSQDFHFVTNGCTKLFPREISAQPGNEKHAVRCCDNKAKTCVSPEPCFLESTYQEASEICLERGLELCRYTEELSEICCQTGCDIDPITMWISDEGLGVSISQTVGVQKYAINSGGSYGGGTSQYSFGSSSSSLQGFSSEGNLSGGGNFGGETYSISSQSNYGLNTGFQQLGTVVKNYSFSFIYREGYQFVANGCLKKFPGDQNDEKIASRRESERHAVRCCDESGSTCISPKPCNLDATFEEAQNTCSDQGLQLCPINEKLFETCCGTGCDIDPTLMWLRDIRESSNSVQFSSISQTESNQDHKIALEGLSFEVATAYNGAKVWLEEKFTFSNLPSYLDGTLFFQLPYKGTSMGSEVNILIYQPSIVYIAYEDSTSSSYGKSLSAAGWSLVTNKGETSSGCCTLTYVWRKYVTLNDLTTISLPQIVSKEFVFSLFVKTFNFQNDFLPEITGASYEVLSAYKDVLVWKDRDFKFSNLPNHLRGSMFFQLGYQSLAQGSLIGLTFSRPSIVYLAYDDIRDFEFEASLEENGWSFVTSNGEIDTGCCMLKKIWKQVLPQSISLEIPVDDFIFAIFVEDQEGFLPKLDGSKYQLSPATNFGLTNLPSFLQGSYHFQLDYKEIKKETNLEISIFKPSSIYILYETTNENFENDLRTEKWSLFTDQSDITNGGYTMTYMWKKHITHSGFTSVSLPSIPNDDFIITILIKEKDGLIPTLETEKLKYGSLNLGYPDYDILTAVDGATVWMGSDPANQFTNLPPYLDGCIFFQLEYNVVTRGSVLTISLQEAATIYLAYEFDDDEKFSDSLKNDGWLLVHDEALIDVKIHTLDYIWKKYVTFDGYSKVDLPPTPLDFVFVIFVQEHGGEFPEIYEQSRSDLKNQRITHELASVVNQPKIWIDANDRFTNIPTYLEGSILFQFEYLSIARGTILEVDVFKQSIIYLSYEGKKSGKFETKLRKQGWSLITDSSEMEIDCCTLNYVWKKVVVTKGTTKTILPEIQQDEFVFAIFVQEYEGFIPKLKDYDGFVIEYEISTASNGATVWKNENYKFSNLPNFLEGSVHFQLEYQVITRGTRIELSVFKKSIIYIAYESTKDGRFEKSLKEQGWALVTREGTIKTGCCTLTYIWKKYVAHDGLTLIDLPETQVDQLVFTVFIQELTIFLPEINGVKNLNVQHSYELATASNGALGWLEEKIMFRKLPSYLDGSIFFQFEYKTITQGTIIEMSIYKESTIYIAYEATKSGQFERSLMKDGWIRVTEEGEIDAGSFTLTFIWRKVFTIRTLTIVSLPEIPFDEFVLVIFIQDDDDGKVSEKLTTDNTITDIDIDFGTDDGIESSGDDKRPSNQGRGDDGDSKAPSFEEVAARPERCVEKVQMVEHTEYDDQLVCKHKYSEQCHQTYVTDYKPQQKEECVDTFIKKCFISHKKFATQENIEVCNTPLICGGEGEKECRSVSETRCETRNHIHSVVDDVVNCETVFETDCKDVTSGYTTTEECTKWPKRKCDVKQLDNKKVTPISECFKVPKEVCGAKGCSLVPGPEQCHDEVKTIIEKKPIENCSVDPKRECHYVTKLVPFLKPTEECVDVPEEVCSRSRTNPKVVKKPVIKKWCYTPKNDE